MAGITSASLTHGLDVAKVLRQVGRKPVSSFRGYLIGLPMGAFAQGQRFGLTLLLNETLQKEIHKRFGNGKDAADSNNYSTLALSFFGSMLAAGAGEALAMPPVVVKNYQIAHKTPSMIAATQALYALNGPSAFFKGVVAGVARKSLANAIVLQTIDPTKRFVDSNLNAMRELTSNQKTAVTWGATLSTGFIAGGVTGCAAEILTNYPDRIKTLMQTKNISMWNAGLEAAQDPFRGALWAGLRKGVIRGLNWGTVGVYTAMLHRALTGNNGSGD